MKYATAAWCAAALVLFPAAAGAQPFRSALYPDDWQPGRTGPDGAFLHDFSYAGYRNGETPPPDNPPGALFNVASFGADASGATDTTAAIQTAITAAEAEGGGVVQFPAGLYRCDGPLSVTHSGVVLQGAGADSSRIFFTGCGGMSDGAHITFSGSVTHGPELPLAADGQDGSARLSVADTGGLAVGDDIAVGWVITPEFVAEHNMTGTWQVCLNEWVPVFRRTIVAVDTASSPPQLVLDAPLRYAAKLRDGASVRRETGYLRECGVTGLGLSNAVNYLDAWTVEREHLLRFQGVKDCWVLRVQSFASPLAADTRGLHLQNSGIHVLDAKRVTVAECRLEKAQNRGSGGCGYLFEVGTSSEILFRDCDGFDGRHNFIQNWKFGTSGCVFLRCHSRGGANVLSATSDIKLNAMSEYHHELAMACLVDSCTLDDGWSAINRGQESSGAGITATQCAVWNARGAGMIRSMQSGLGYVIGTAGNPVYTSLLAATGAGTAPEDWVEGREQAPFLFPHSLYEDQLARRLGRPAEASCADCAAQSALFDGEWPAFADVWGALDPDTPILPDSVIPERWTLELAARYLCDAREPRHAAVENAYYTNLWLLLRERTSVRRETAPFVHVLAALLSVSDDTRSHLTNAYKLAEITVLAEGRPLAASGDADGDGQSNAAEYESSLKQGGDMGAFVTAAMSPGITGEALLSATGAGALAALAALVLLAGALRQFRGSLAPAIKEEVDK